MALEHIVHSIPPTYDERSRVLVLGSLPSPKSRELQFNYGHPQNRFWRVVAALADEPVPATNERKRDFCLRHHIALWDVVASCDIEGASDASIRNASPNDLSLITNAAPIEAVYCTGAKAFELYNKLGCEQLCGLPAVKLPSTSPANAACGFEALTKAYAQLFEHTHEFEPPTLDVPRVVELEQQIAADGTSLAELMDRAGTALARRVEKLLEQSAEGTYESTRPIDPRSNPLAPQPTATFLCGSGNNGGDGWVATEILAKKGIPVIIVTGKLPEEITAQPAHDAALRSAETLRELGGRVVSSEDSFPVDENGIVEPVPLIMVNPTNDELKRALERTWVIADALLGTGFNHSSVKEPYHSFITTANDIQNAVKLAVDVPSGVSAQNGYAPESTHACFHADETITMITCKPGLETSTCGTVRVAPLAYIEPYLE